MADEHIDCFYPAIILIILLGLLLLIVITSLFKYFQLYKIQKAIENSWLSDGTCTDQKTSRACKLHYEDELGAPPTAIVPTEFSKKLGARLADYVARIEMVENRIKVPAPPGHTQVHLALPRSGPAFGVVWMYESTMVVSLRCTITRHEIQDDLTASQVEFDTGKEVRHPLKVVPNIHGEKAYVHKGFYRIFKRYQAELCETIKQHRPKLVLICGHSLGGAVATLMSVSLAELRASLLPFVEQIACYVFGTPRVGNGNFHQRVLMCEKLVFWRVVNKADTIQDLPLRITPNVKYPNDCPYYYEHAGLDYSFDDNRGSWKTCHNLPCYMSNMVN